MKYSKLLLFIVVQLFCGICCAYDFKVDGIRYNRIVGTDDEVEVAELPVPDGAYVYTGSKTIPESIIIDGSTFRVTAIGNRAFYGQTLLKAVYLPNSIVSIGNMAFMFCEKLTSIQIPSSCITIGSHAFRESGLTSISIPESVTSLGDGIFYFCKNLTSAFLPNSISTIPPSSFWGTRIKEIDIPSSVTTIGEQAFKECTSLGTLVLPNSITSIGARCFADCTYLNRVISEIEMPFEIESSVFRVGQPWHNTLVIPNGTTSKYNQFQGWTKYFLSVEEAPSSSYELSITSEGNGYALYNGAQIFNTSRSFSVTKGTSITISFIPDKKHRIKVVKVNNVDCTSGVLNSQYVISNISENTIVAVEFEAIPPTTYTLSVAASGYGYAYYNNATIRNGTKSFILDEGTSAKITFTPDNGYRIKNVKRNGLSVSVTNNQYTVGNIQSDTSIEVEFEAIPIPTYSLIINASGRGFVSYDGSNIRNGEKLFPVTQGSSATVNIYPDEGYRIKNVILNGVNETAKVSNNQYSINDVRGDVTLNVEFEAVPPETYYTLSITSEGEGYAYYDGYTVRNTTNMFSVNEGTSHTINFIPDDGYRVKSVKKNGVTITSSISNNRYTVSNIQVNTTLEVVFEEIPVTTYDLTISATGSGAASFSGASIRNSTRSFYVNAGTSPSITIAPDNGYRIKALKKNGSTVISNYSGSYQYTVSNISANTTVTVEFEAIPVTTYTLSISATGSGYVSYGGIAFRNTTRSSTVNAGTSHVITITPDNGYRIKTLKKDGSTIISTYSGSYQYTVSSISANTTVSVEFEAIPPTTYTLSISATGSGYVSYGGIAFRNTTRSSTVNAGTSPVITITPDNGYRIKTVKKNGYTVISSYSGSYQYTVSNISSYTTIDVEFEAIPVTTYSLTVKATGNGYVSFSGTTVRNSSKIFTVNAGSSVTVSFSPDNGYRLKSVKNNGSAVNSSVYNNMYTVSNIQGNITVEVEFEAIPVTTYDLTIDVKGNGYVAYSGSTFRNNIRSYTVNAGTSPIISVTPDNGYQIKSLKKNGSTVIASYSGSYQYTVSTISENTTVTVEFEEIPTTSFTLTITASGYGSATYYSTGSAQSNTVRNGSQSFLVSEGESATIYFTPDATCQINYVKVNGSDRTPFLDSNKYTVSTISANTTVEVEFTGGTKAFTYQGINYNVSSFDDKTILLAKGSYGKLLDVPAKLSYQGAEWTVTGTEADALDGNEGLAAVVWHPSAPFTASASNPNLLLYVNDASYAKTTIRNVIADGTAQDIILTDAASGNEFYCPQRFIAQNISYTHQYNMETGIGEARGWETIALPFSVQKVSHDSKGQIIPFAVWRDGNTTKPFWLMRLDSDGWKEADAIVAYTPYIISMPNNASYMPQYLLNGVVTFSSENVAVEKTENMHTGTYNGRTFTPAFAEVGMGDGAFELNVSNELETNNSGAVDGSRFVLNLRKVHPFEAYMTMTTRGVSTIDVSDGMGIATDSNDGQPLRIYNMSGMLLKSPSESSTIEEMRRTLPAGVYIINRRKVIVK